MARPEHAFRAARRPASSADKALYSAEAVTMSGRRTLNAVECVKMKGQGAAFSIGFGMMNAIYTLGSGGRDAGRLA